MFKEIDTIIHSAATTRFDERYDIAMNINVLGAFNVLKFAKRCANLKILVHVSTVITSTYKEPFPGWIEGIKTLDTYILVYGKGISNIFLADPNTNADLIPGDMVVNSIFAAILAHENNKSSQNHFIYHIGSSQKNPLKYDDIKLFTHHYFTKNPWIDKDGNIIKAKEILQLANILSWYYFIDETYKNLKRKIDRAIRLSELYEPYTIFHGSFDDSNTERLRMAMKECKMDDVLQFDSSCINWEDYFMNTHIPGVLGVTRKPNFQEKVDRKKQFLKTKVNLRIPYMNKRYPYYDDNEYWIDKSMK
ncbi:hypothetical protein HAX54_047240, partial [Datura stramonium]|nr:hypothetical protein [Datura stramonium]